MLWGGLLTNTGPDVGWFAYVPLSGPQYSPGHRTDIWSQMITFTEVSALGVAVCLATTILRYRAPGMTLNRMPILLWEKLVLSFMVIFAMPAVMVASGLLLLDRLVGTHFFNPAEGGDVLLYQHLFWFFGHPEVYIIFLPGAAIVSTLIPCFCRRRIFGHTPIVVSVVATGFIGFGVWVHHMFATGLTSAERKLLHGGELDDRNPHCGPVFLLAGHDLAWPRANAIAHAVVLRILFRVPDRRTLRSHARIRPGGTQVHDTYFIVAHFHYVLIGGALFPMFAGLYFWFPKITGRMPNETLGKWHFWLFFIGFNLTLLHYAFPGSARDDAPRLYLSP